MPSLAGWGLKFLQNATPERYRESLRANRRLAAYSQEVLEEIDRDLGLDCAMHADGGLWVFRDAAELEHPQQQPTAHLRHKEKQHR